VVGDAVTVLGSPLCNVSAAAVCNPDDAGCSAACASEVLGDAAVAQSDGTCHDGHALACHVTAVHGDAGLPMVVPACSQPQGYPTLGTAEDACQSSDNCAIGFECVINDQNPDAGGAGVCRHYCCDNLCSGHGSFCDIETAVSGAVAVPVCAPAQPACELLKDTCPSGLTCQIVDQTSGLVACVKPGSATAGQSCEITKCAKGFSCIGEFPSRECAQLCNVELNDCTNGTCTQNTVLSSNDSVVGICAE
jgi:hypothetical protein